MFGGLVACRRMKPIYRLKHIIETLQLQPLEHRNGAHKAFKNSGTCSGSWRSARLPLDSVSRSTLWTLGLGFRV